MPPLPVPVENEIIAAADVNARQRGAAIIRRDHLTGHTRRYLVLRSCGSCGGNRNSSGAQTSDTSLLRALLPHPPVLLLPRPRAHSARPADARAGELARGVNDVICRTMSVKVAAEGELIETGRFSPIWRALCSCPARQISINSRSNGAARPAR